MTHRLREDPASLDRYVARVSDHTSIGRTQLEKDFWLTEALRGIVATAEHAGFPVFLKGGTSLSKVFVIIERFSEDVDVLVGLPLTDALMSARRRDAVLRELVAGAITATGLAVSTDPGATRKGEKRAAHLHRSLETSGVAAAWTLPPLRPEGVLVELGRWGGSQPHVRATIRSLLAEHAHAAGLGPFQEQDPILMDVVEPVRTAVEKLSLLHSAGRAADERRRRGVARHYYDVWCLLQHPATAEALTRPSLVAALAEEVLLQTLAVTPAAHREAVHERPVEGFSSSSAFDAVDSQLAATRDAYETIVLGELIWPTARSSPSFEACCRAVREFPGGL